MTQMRSGSPLTDAQVGYLSRADAVLVSADSMENP